MIGKKDFIKKARRVRKVFGGGMRQAGIIAAGGLFALKNNVSRLKQDHIHAKLLEKVLNDLFWVKEVVPVETNIVVVVLNDESNRDRVIAILEEKGIRVMPFGPGMIRFVTHLDISPNDIDRTIVELKSLTV